MGGKSGGGASKQYNHFQTIGYGHCRGPQDELVAWMANGKKAWPIADEWAAGTAYVVTPTPSMVSRGERVWTCILAHTATGNDAPAAATDSSLDAPVGAATHWVEFSVKRADHPASYAFTTEKNGPVVFYWGTETQTASAYLNDNEFGEVHPPYLGLCYSVLGQGRKTAATAGFLAGREQENSPTVTVLCRKYPQTSLVSGVTVYEDGAVNPAAFLEERLTDELAGMGVPLSSLDAASFQRLAEVAARDRGRYYISALMNSQEAFRALMDDYGITLDWFLRFSHTDGTFVLGAWPRNTGQPFDVNVTVSAGDVVQLLSDFSWTAYETFDGYAIGAFSSVMTTGAGFGWTGTWITSG